MIKWNLSNDLSINYGDGKTTSYCRKALTGEQRCFQSVEVEPIDENRQLIDRQISGGKFIRKEEYGDR